MNQKPNLTLIPIAAVVDTQASERVMDFQHVAHLADSLREISQLAPIVVQDMGEGASTYKLWDGAHRLRALEQAGLESVHAYVYPSTVTDTHVRRCVLESEFLTRKDSWAIQCLKLQELKSLYELCYPQTVPGKWKRGDKTTGAAIPSFVNHIVSESGNKRSTIAEMLTLARELGAVVMRKLDAANLPKQTGKELLKLETETERIAVVEHIQSLRTAHRSGRRAEPNVATALDAMKKSEREKACAGIQFTSNDARVVRTRMEHYTAITDESIDAIITDPLYHQEHRSLYGVAAERAARWLKPGGFAAFYCGRLHLDEVMSLLGKHLTFRTLITLHHKQHFGNVGSSKLSTDCKHILVYQNPGADVEFYESVKGVIVGTGLEKDAHEFQQNTSDLDNLIDAISKPGEVILDMFAGSGTTGVAAILKSRRTILLEEDAADCDECRARLAAALNQSKVISLHPKTQQFMGMFDGHPSIEPAALRTALRTAM